MAEVPLIIEIQLQLQLQYTLKNNFLILGSQIPDLGMKVKQGRLKLGHHFKKYTYRVNNRANRKLLLTDFP